MKIHTIALVILPHSPTRFDILQDESEIESFENALRLGEVYPIHEIIHRRELISQKENLQADYIEELLCLPSTSPCIKNQGILWLNSKIKLDSHRRAETEAAQIIANYAFQIYENDPSRTDLLLSGPKSQVRVRIFPPSNPAKAKISSQNSLLD